MITQMFLALIYLLMGIAMSFCVGVAIGAFIGAIRALFKLFASRTAWFALITFLVVAYVAVSFAFAILPLAGELGDKTRYQSQTALLVGAFFGLATWMMPIAILAMGSKELVTSQSFKPYGLVYGMIVFYTCGFLGLLMVVGYLIIKLDAGWLFTSIILYPITFVVAPFVMGFKDGIWWPFLLHFGGLFGGGMLMSLSEEKKKDVV